MTEKIIYLTLTPKWKYLTNSGVDNSIEGINNAQQKFERSPKSVFDILISRGVTLIYKVINSRVPVILTLLNDIIKFKLKSEWEIKVELRPFWFVQIKVNQSG